MKVKKNSEDSTVTISLITNHETRKLVNPHYDYYPTNHQLE